ncbi:MAG: hypothetical protein ACYTEQ_01805 [Planctomycetota bacterium]|jgi:hypothetical protein
MGYTMFTGVMLKEVEARLRPTATINDKADKILLSAGALEEIINPFVDELRKKAKKGKDAPFYFQLHVDTSTRRIGIEPTLKKAPHTRNLSRYSKGKGGFITCQPLLQYIHATPGKFELTQRGGTAFPSFSLRKPIEEG